MNPSTLRHHQLRHARRAHQATLARRDAEIRRCSCGGWVSAGRTCPTCLALPAPLSAPTEATP